MDPHKRIGTLAERLEFSNALRKQMESELRAERLAHGKTQALVHELEHRICELQITPPKGYTPKWTPEERAALARDPEVASLREQQGAMQKRVKELERKNRALVNELIALERKLGIER